MAPSASQTTPFLRSRRARSDAPSHRTDEMRRAAVFLLRSHLRPEIGPVLDFTAAEFGEGEGRGEFANASFSSSALAARRLRILHIFVLAPLCPQHRKAKDSQASTPNHRRTPLVRYGSNLLSSKSLRHYTFDLTPLAASPYADHYGTQCYPCLTRYRFVPILLLAVCTSTASFRATAERRDGQPATCSSFCGGRAVSSPSDVHIRRSSTLRFDFLPTDYGMFHHKSVNWRPLTLTLRFAKPEAESDASRSLLGLGLSPCQSSFERQSWRGAGWPKRIRIKRNGFRMRSLSANERAGGKGGLRLRFILYAFGPPCLSTVVR